MLASAGPLRREPTDPSVSFWRAFPRHSRSSRKVSARGSLRETETAPRWEAALHKETVPAGG